jgi:hypothetical protein
MPMQHVRRDNDQGSRFDRFSIQIVAANRKPADGRDRRLKANGLFGRKSAWNPGSADRLAMVAVMLGLQMIQASVRKASCAAAR